MLGEKLGEESGKITGTRVLPSEGGAPKVEVSFQAMGKTLGVDTTDIGTYWSVTRPDGSLYGNGQGILITNDGGAASWTGQGIGRFNASGGVTWRGAFYYLTGSGSLARLNSMAVVYEFETDANQNARNVFWEWK
jgi:hypothetical protein